MNEATQPDYFASALARARTRRAANDIPGALRELRSGLDGKVDYLNAVAVASFLKNTTQNNPPAGWPAVHVALIGPDSVELLKPVFRALAFRDGWWPIFYDAPYGAWAQDILDPNSGLRAFKPEATFILRSWRAAGADAEIYLRDELSLATHASQGLGMVFWPGFDLPRENTKTFVTLNEHLRADLPPDITWVDLAEAQSLAGEDWDDERLWQAVKQHPSAAGSIVLVELWLALLRARQGRVRKVLVTDLDDTLWGGTVGEDGVDGLHIGKNTPDGESRTAFQDYLISLKNRGVLLTVCSKNNDADALEVFKRRNMPLKRDDFAAWIVNWNDKTENLRSLAKSLNVSLDAFVFVDNDPAERARVRETLPEVAVPELSSHPSEWIATLRNRRFFDTLTLTKEDANRHAAYQANQQRAAMAASSTSLEDFLRGLDMVCEHGPFTPDNFARVEQLLSRTNQWNLTTRRHTRAQLDAFRTNPNVLTHVFHLRDRFGDNGLVGLWIATQRPGSANTASTDWEIDSFLMSCRVIGRGLEQFMFNTLVETLRKRGAKHLFGTYIPTAKNTQVAGFFPKLGFQTTSEKAEDKTQTFLLTMVAAKSQHHYISQTAAC